MNKNQNQPPHKIGGYSPLELLIFRVVDRKTNKELTAFTEL